jgi:hypothetical protein
MKKLSVLGIIIGGGLLAAAPYSLQWSPKKNVVLSLDRADARVGRPATAVSIAGVHRRAYRRAARRTVYAGAAGYGYGSYYGGYGYPAYTAPSAPYYGTSGSNLTLESAHSGHMPDRPLSTICSPGGHGGVAASGALRDEYRLSFEYGTDDLSLAPI